MKHISTLQVILFALASATPLRAQEAAPSAPPGREQRDFAPRGPMANFTPEEREKLKAAREKAMEDPKVQDALENRKDANEKFQSVMRPALLAVDPSLEPILDKMQKARQGNQGGAPDAVRKMPDRPLSVLTSEEREKLKAAHDKVKDNPELKSAQEERIAAEKAFGTAMHDAMVAADPTVEPLLKKIGEFKREHPGMGDGQGRPPGKNKTAPL